MRLAVLVTHIREIINSYSILVILEGLTNEKGHSIHERVTSK